MPWDFTPKLQPLQRTCRKGHIKQQGRERCHVCDNAREKAAWARLKGNPTALAAHNAAAARRKAERKKHD
jgi:hypothetical protein